MKRKLLALILALLLCQGLFVPAYAVVEETASVKVDDVTGYSRSDGIYTVVRDGRYGFYHVDGSELAAPEYAWAEDFQDGMAVVSLHGSRYGYLDRDGRMSIIPQFSQAFPFSQDRAFAVLIRRGEPVLVLLDREGQELASYPDAALRPGDRIQFSEGLAVFPVQAEAVEAEVDGEDAEGEAEALPPAPLVYRVVDLDGREVCTLTDAYVDVANGYHDGRIAVSEAGEWIETGKDSAPRFQAEPGSWGYRDAAGRLAVAYQYDEAAPFSEGMAGVGRSVEDGEYTRTLYGFIGADGGELLPLEYDGFLSCVNGSGAVLRNRKWAFVDGGGQLLTQFLFDRLSHFTEGIASVKAGGRQGVVNEEGLTLFALEGRQFLPCDGGVIPVQDNEGLWGVYDRDGDLLVDFEYERALHWDGYLWLKRGGLWRVYLTEDVLADRAAAAAAADTDSDSEPVAAVGSFLDVPPDAYYAQAVTWATDSDIVAGTGGGQFSPDRLCTKGEVLVCLWRAAGRPEAHVENPFEDVSPTHYYYQAALWAYETGMTEGEIFAAAEPCTRAMAVTYLWVADGRPYGLTDVFTDVPLDADCVQAVAWAVDHKITGGNDAGLFEPEAICSRGQMVTFLYRYYG
ncbi:MAG: WG repeat-containing protein [Oscillospiraceae bacterium]|nr:WG repeat-containing protein [Oscillospiraceae bacterium]